MFNNHPILFIGCILAITCYGIGLVILFFWWLNCKSTVLSITNKRCILRTGVLSKNINVVRHEDIRNIQIKQSLGQRLFDTGTIYISSSGQSDMEIKASGMPHPNKIQNVIDTHRV